MRSSYVLILVAAIVLALLGFLLMTLNAPQPQQQRSPNAGENLQKSDQSNYPASVQDAIRQDMNAPKGYVLKSIQVGFRGGFFLEANERSQMTLTDAMLSSNPKVKNLVGDYIPNYNAWFQNCERIGMPECEEINENPPESMYPAISPDEYNSIKSLLKSGKPQSIDLEPFKSGPVGRLFGTFVTYDNSKFFLALYTTWDFPSVKEFNFDKDQSDSTPLYLQIGKTGSGTNSVWVIKRESSAPSAPNVLTQTSEEAVDSHFPYVLVSSERFGDFIVSVKFKSVSGKIAQTAGMVFRFVDSDNYYVLAANPKKNTVILYKYVDGKRLIIVEGAATVSANEWHTMKIFAVGNQMKMYFDGRLLLATIVDNTFKEGMIGLWTEADSIASFDDLKINL